MYSEELTNPFNAKSKLKKINRVKKVTNNYFA